ncbi:MAG: MFS transporter [Planctomycetia bacterium]|nr:MFS transporter [Planctomycetia bacterium]
MSSASSSSSPSLNDRILFWASFFTLIAAGIGFSVRGFILKDWGAQFGFTQSELGTITGGGLIGFGIAIIFFSFCADRFGYGKLMLVAFLLHASSAVVTFAATPVYNAYGKEGAYWCLYIGMWLFALGNGTCEAVINPLTATLFPNNKTHWLNILHAGWPLGLLLGAAILLGFRTVGESLRWEIKLGVFLIPVLLYGLLMFNRPFPHSEAKTAGITLPEMMRTVGMLGVALAVGLFGLLLNNELPPLLKKAGIEAPNWIGWAVAGVIWIGYGVVTKFAPGSIIIAFLYLMHALVGYVELGVDQWMGNITGRVLNNEQQAEITFLWTSGLMFVLRFFAGPIVHKINPVGLLFSTALLGVAGLWMLGQDFTNTFWPWMVGVTVYALGKTFYWPTLLGVISERFPKGGALALGLSGGIGMMSAGLLGAPGIGWKQDYFAVEKIQQEAPNTYNRYVARGDDGKPAEKPFPLLTQFMPDQLPPVAGMDNSKLKVFDDFNGIVAKVRAAQKDNTPTDKMPLVLADDYLLGAKWEGTYEMELIEDGQPVKVTLKLVQQDAYDAIKKRAESEGKEPPPLLKTTLQDDLATVANLEREGKKVDDKLKDNLTKLKKWWDEEGLPNYSKDRDPIKAARLYGDKQALLWTAVVPAALAVGFLLLILYFIVSGGYKQIHLEGDRPSRPTGGAPTDAWGR